MFARWTEIESLEHVVRSRDLYVERGGTPQDHITYRGKIKLHGTNSCVRVESDDRVFFQSRTSDVTEVVDNAGFATWATQHVGYWRLLAAKVPPGTSCYVYGEWSGKGINKGCAVHDVADKFFAVFALGYTASKVDLEEAEFYLMTDPNQIMAFMGTLPSNVYVLPWTTDPISLDYSDKDDLRAKAKVINQQVLDVEQCDPWIKATFGYEGIGEGIVLYPITDNVWELRHLITKPMFKAKGEKHRVKKAQKPVVVDIEKMNGVEAFAATFVTEARCEQGVTAACDGEILMPKMGLFLAWISKDVLKESEAELEESGLAWKDVAQTVTTTARNWFMEKAKTL